MLGLSNDQEQLVAKGLALTFAAQTWVIGIFTTGILIAVSLGALNEPKAFAWFGIARVAVILGMAAGAVMLLAYAKAAWRVILFKREYPLAYATGQSRLEMRAAEGKNYLWQVDASGRPIKKAVKPPKG